MISSPYPVRLEPSFLRVQSLLVSTLRYRFFMTTAISLCLWVSSDGQDLNSQMNVTRPAFHVPEMKALPDNLKPFEYVDVTSEIPDYVPEESWGIQGERGNQEVPTSKMQRPVSAEESIEHIMVPKGFHVELFASEPELDGKPICMAWDHRGRLWVAETDDYPNERQDGGMGNDRIRICEDTDGDAIADRFTVFADNLSIPTAMAFSRGGVIVQNGTETLFLQDTNGDERADVRSVLVSNWKLDDTHAGVSNFQYGLDNWIWATQGYNHSEPIANGKPQESFRMGIFRMQTDGLQVEFIRSTNNNTWGLGQSEEGLIFASTANGNPSIYMPIANRYYERVRGWTPSLTLSSIADSNDFHPITKNIRQVDWNGGYSAAAGHALYTARSYPQEYWNRVAFVNEPTGHLVGSFVLWQDGSDFHSSNPFNLFASDDQWTAPIMSEVGPDGQVWVIDWYNYVVQHNHPTPGSVHEGKGRAYETKLRDKDFARIYRVVADESKAATSVPDLSTATADQLVAALTHHSMVVRKHAQRLLVERGKQDLASPLIKLVEDLSTDEIGLNVGAIHALWTLHGLDLLDGKHEQCNTAVQRTLRHPSAGVRLNALRTLPPRRSSLVALLDANVLKDEDSLVRLAALLAVSDLATGEPADHQFIADHAAEALLDVLDDSANMTDRWIPDALTSAAAQLSGPFLRQLAKRTPQPGLGVEIVRRVAEHHARGENTNDLAQLLADLNAADPEILTAVIDGFLTASGHEATVKLDVMTDVKLLSISDRVPPTSRGRLIKLATGWGSRRFSQYGQQLIDETIRKVHDTTIPASERIAAAAQAVDYLQRDRRIAISLLDEVSPRTEPEVAIGLMRALEASRWEGLGDELIGRLAAMTPSVKHAAVSLLLKRPRFTLAMLRTSKSDDLLRNSLTLEQRLALASHPDTSVRQLAKKLLTQSGTLPSEDRRLVLDQYQTATHSIGDPSKGFEVYTKHCSKCHVHGTQGIRIGPDLTGMAVHPKRDLLIHILDPSRHVESNFRSYAVLTVDGIVMTGMLGSESRTAISLIDAEGQTKSILREDIEQLVLSSKSLMPEGLENSIVLGEMTDLLEFLTSKSRYLPLPLDRYATAISTKGMFLDDGPDRLKFPAWDPIKFRDVPFQLTDPQGDLRPNVILLHSPLGIIPSRMPHEVSLPCNTAAKSIHFLSGVSGWGYPVTAERNVVLTVRLTYVDGASEDHPLINGVHFADYIRRHDVPESEYAMGFADGQQLRYFNVSPKRTAVIKSIELIKGPNTSAPVVMAITIETAQPTN
ncbi:hypothetical protein Pla22_03910 [Rubripirellula amarantea]|uniref:Cytochrome c domain-containing protein n=1 Tax=Rubripirellula amarantea TaxID=2527999 RepID=A0A5C5WR94_9BACT|nr:PVC-type heme-binding CxxCH protein [Rubripirellula amarantea]TWT52765.1 hypothetical protein Pla22_03910 [Rubripirellula amarantea]